MLAYLASAGLLFGIIGRIEHYRFIHELIDNDNQALGIRFASFLLAAMLAFYNIVKPSDIGWWDNVGYFLKFGGAILVLLAGARYFNDYIIIYGVHNNKEVIDRHNNAVALVEGATYIATACIISGALSRWKSGPWVVLEWFFIGEVFILAPSLLYHLIAPHFSRELEGQNHACALSFFGFLVSAGMAVGSSITSATDFEAVLIRVSIWRLLMVASYITANFLILLISWSRFRKEIMQDKNIAVGLIEAISYFTPTLFYIRVWPTG